MTQRAALRHRAVDCGGERGSALLVVLVMLGLIAALASVVARSVSGAALAVGAARAGWQADADLRAGLELGAATILKLGGDLRSAEATIDLADRRIAVRITNERGRIDLNAAGAGLLTQLLQSNGLRESEAVALAAKVVEWRGAPAAGAPGPAPGGAVPQAAASRSFLHPWQLAAVPGFSKALVAAIAPLVTVASASDRVDPSIAGDRVLRALPGTSQASVDAFRDARDGNSSRDAAILLLGVPKMLVTADAAPGWRIEVSTLSSRGRIDRGEAVIAVVSGDSEPYRVLYVLDGRERSGAAVAP